VGGSGLAASDSHFSENILQNLITLVGIVLFIVAAYSDVKTFRIPNLLVAAVALLAVTRLIVLADPNAALYTVVASVALLVVGFVLFWQGFIGGGDAKLITAAALLVGYHDLFSFLVLMGLCGGLISLAELVIHKYLPLYAGPRFAVLLPKARLAVPYGVAIATAGSVTLIFQTLFATSFLG
jgi:prepilin peptidase CpaA